jgi:hypothetical protein
MDFACDADNDALLAIAEEERGYLDQAFFVLMFGILEKQVNLLAVARTSGIGRRMAMREAAFENRLDAATKVASEVRPGAAAEEIRHSREQFLGWYGIRNDVAHGEPSTRVLDLVGLPATSQRHLHVIERGRSVLGDSLGNARHSNRERAERSPARAVHRRELAPAQQDGLARQPTTPPDPAASPCLATRPARERGYSLLRSANHALAEE